MPGNGPESPTLHGMSLEANATPDPTGAVAPDYEDLDPKDLLTPEQRAKKLIRSLAARIILVDTEVSSYLAFKERTGKLSRYILQEDVASTLIKLYDICGHFSDRITQQRAVGKYYWPSRFHDIVKHCRETAGRALHPGRSRLLHSIPIRTTLGADITPEDQVRVQSILDKMKTDLSALLLASLAEEHHAVRLARLDEIRTSTLDRRLRYQMKLAEDDKKRGPALKAGDAVLVRRLQQDQEHGHKFEVKYDSLYILEKITSSGQAGILKSMHGESPLQGKKYYLNDLRLFVPDSEGRWKKTSKANRAIQLKLRGEVNQRRKFKKHNKERVAQGLPELPNPDRRHHPAIDDPLGPRDVSWNPSIGIGEPAKADETSTAYWDRKSVALSDLLK
ncbi:uncharacterized protein MYCGRDRAFT_93618 [Zymoseptoria tritici IPO323]|uniref:Integrase zinc-binding domain-containing protein n=1 Tax=Zymoseptoria tritici (strain CBS 115943 / IPO323) TaxID=336722 RepID=F9XE39_ZYMTI|nr:uncharacterized protein MYCGRDRAFT_93618 [Zymoseptoria tritici IPO323]EGP86975.1 hypothetical protein MYCGRDRAFT_93618 [Zymoseptoria tritici IPO323]